MSTLEIDVSERVKAVVDEQVQSGRFSSQSDYVCRLIEEDESRREQAALESLLVSRVEDLRTVTMNDADWAQMRQEFQRRVTRRGALIGRI